MNPSRPRTLTTLTTAALLATTLGTAHASTPTLPTTSRAPLAGLRVLLGNDDSMRMARPDASDGKGLYEVRRALCAAGADVVVMAPASGQSGAGTSATGSGRLSLEHRTTLPAGYENDCSRAPARGAVYGVCKGVAPCTPAGPGATPADTVRLALGGALAAKAGWKDGPDLVVTGANFGPNIASVVNESGTVGAALAAIDEGIPAVALNSSYGPDLDRPAVTDTTYRRTAEYGADLIARLHRRALLTPAFVVNVNYPHLAEDQRPRGTAWTSVGTRKLIRNAYTSDDGATFTIAGSLCTPGAPTCRPETKPDADHKRLDQGWVTITPITPDRTFTGAQALPLARYVHTL
ncbi:5'/3'-nucleotidase SurE [Streptomyces sp. BI20]|uniref:5'/3'-nucleotidase SurE n=1 Tax=Streptomyces sp. BI20 TaxID=3403460 RepID=UPI003C76E0F2